MPLTANITNQAGFSGLDASAIISGVLPVSRGGTGITSGNLVFSIGSIIYGNNVSLSGNLLANTVAVNGRLTTSSILASDGLGGLVFNQTTRRVNISYLTWTFEVDGGVVTPLNKTKVEFVGTGADQSFVVPSGITHVFAKIWGAGGGAGRAGNWTYGADGGGGGHTRGLLPVTPGETLTIKVGSGGYTTTYSASYGGGGGGDQAAGIYGGQGGGGSSLFRGTTPLLYAGGGGGGGSSRAWDGNIGGAGGGLVGGRGQSPYDGKAAYGGGGGTQTAGGTATAGNSGTLYTGGSSVNYAGGGGGGYYGGGGGGYSEANTMGGGGGGSGYISSGIMLGATYGGTDRTPGFYWDNDLSKAISNSTMPGYGGINPQNSVGTGQPSGGAGFIVLYY